MTKIQLTGDLMALRDQNFSIYKNNDLIIDLTVRDRSKTAVGINAARFVLSTDQDNMETDLEWDKQITTSLTADGQITDDVGGLCTFFATNVETTALTLTHKSGEYYYQIAVRKINDDKFITVTTGRMTVLPGVPVWTPTP